MQFLSTHNFDFNRTFYDGAFYLSRESEKLFKDPKKMNDLKEGLKKMNQSIDPDMLAFIDLHL